MRISDWSSDVCSSDLLEPIPVVDADEPETTEEEIEGFNIIRAILREDVDVRRIVMRDAKTYCAVLLDDNNRKPIARLHFNGRSEEHTSELTSLMRISYAVFCLKKKKYNTKRPH